MRYPKRSQYKYTRKPYRIRNWAQYETALRKRGELTLWFSEDAIEAWRQSPSSVPGGQRTYSDIAIETALTVRVVYGLALRQTEGFLRSVATLLELSIPIPDHSTLSRRSKQLASLSFEPMTTDGPIHVLVDSTGLRVHSGNALPPTDRRAWRKLHLAVNADTAEILASEVTTHRSRDASQVSELLDPINNDLASFTADGAYDVTRVYDAIAAHRSQRETRIVIPPRRNAQLSRFGTSQRDTNIRWIGAVGRRRWEKESEYTRRSLVEAAISRYKRLIGRRLQSRTLPSQLTEARIGCAVLNRMTRLGMPDSCRAA